MPSFGKRRGLSLGLAGVLIAATAVAGSASQLAARDADGTTEHVDQIGGGSGAARFAGYHGFVDDSSDAARALPTDDSGVKSEQLGHVGVNPPGAQDVPGSEAAPSAAVEPDAPRLVQPDEARGDSPAELRRALSEIGPTDTAGGAAVDRGLLRVVVTMNVPIELEAEMSGTAVAEQREAIDDSIDTLEAVLDGTGSSVLQPYEVLPSAVTLVDSAGLEALLASPDVVAVQVDRAFAAALNVSTGVIDSDLLNGVGVHGNNYEGSTEGSYEVAILDSGVRNDHQAFTGRIVAQACFSALSWCPNGMTSQVGGDAGTHCTYTTGTSASQCQHGTHVAGIAAGNIYSGGHEGVAPQAGIVAVQIGHRSCNAPNFCWRYFFSDLDFALAHVIGLLPSRNIAAVNMSLGGPLYTTACDGDFATTQNLFAQLQSAGVAPVVAAGNDASATQVSYPACLSGSYAVSATTDGDVPAGFTNSNALTSWWAPGVLIDAPISTSSTAHGNKSGTSMATPHVVGAFALLRECLTYNSSSAVASGLSASGVNITRNGVTRRRINVLDAATATVNNNDFSSAENLNGDGPFDDYDWNVCADAEPGEPPVGSPTNTVWWNWTPTSTGTATISTNDGAATVTTFDTQLSVFTGNSLGSLNLVAYDDDGGVSLRSRVTIPVTGGQTYRIRVDGFGPANGELNLHVEVDAAPICRGLPATIVGTTGSDNIIGTAGNDVIFAGAGHDFVDGRGGNDTICLGAGDDEGEGGPGSDVIEGGNGDDEIRGQDGDDVVYAGGHDDVVFGGNGDDTLNGMKGRDTVKGDDGDDGLWGGDGNDELGGGEGRDEIYGGDGEDTITGSNGLDKLRGGRDNDFIAGGGNLDNIDGNGGNDVLIGGRGKDRVYGGPGDDVLRGRVQDDKLYGGKGRDRLYGEGGDHDVLRGGDERDSLSGGSGNDDVCRGGAGPDVHLRGCEVISGIP